MIEDITGLMRHRGKFFIDNNGRVFNYEKTETVKIHYHKIRKREKKTTATVLWLKDGEPMVFGADSNKGIRLDGNIPTVVELGDKWSKDDLLIHNKRDYMIASMLSNMTSKPETPEPIGVLYAIDAPTYEDNISNQIKSAIDIKPKGSIQDIINSGDTWVVK